MSAENDLDREGGIDDLSAVCNIRQTGMTYTVDFRLHGHDIAWEQGLDGEFLLVFQASVLLLGVLVTLGRRFEFDFGVVCCVVV